MKRCPECDFLYEDDQRLCDMDGKALVHDPRAFPENSATSAGHAAKHLWQRFAIAVPLTVLAGLAFYVLQHQPGVQASHPAAVVISTEPASLAGQPASSNDAAPATTVQATVTVDSPRGSEEGAQPQGVGRDAARSEADPSAAEGTKGSEQGTDVNSKEDSPEAIPPASPKSTEKPVKPQASSRRRASANDAEKDSKLTSLLKKTGRILKKPFKL
jgi:hypothetical protein